MNNPIPITDAHWALLAQLLPPVGLVLVGAGAQLLPVQSPVFDRVLAVEADAAQAKRLMVLAKGHATVDVVHAVAGQADGQADFFAASNPFESGLVDPSQLMPLWRGLKATGSAPVAMQTLDALQNDWGHSANWLWVDCFPAAQVLAGASNMLGACDVVVARVVHAAESVPGANLADVLTIIAPYSFRLVGLLPERHPSVAAAVFVKDKPALLAASLQQETQAKQALQAKLDAEAKAHADSQAQAQQLSQDKATLQTQKEAEIQAKAELQQKLSAETQAKAELTQKLEAETKAKTDTQQKLQQETQAKQALQVKLDAEAKAKAEAQAQAQQLSQDKATLQTQKEAEIQAKAELQQKLSAETQAKAELTQKLEAEIRAKTDTQQKLQQETQAKQALQVKLDAEAKAKAEAQAQAQQLSQDKATLQTQKEAEAKAKVDVAQKLLQETQAKQALQAKLDAEVKAKAEVQAALSKEAESKKSLAAQNADLKQTISQLKNENQVMLNESEKVNGQYSRMQDELIRTTAQVELIKELVLQGKLSL